MALQPGTNKQVPEHSIMDAFNKQTYLGNQFTFAESLAITGTSEQAIYVLSNPVVTASSFPVNWKAIFLNYKSFSVGTATQSATFRFYVNPTISSAGTAKTPVNARSVSATTSISALAGLPTASANGTLVGIIAANAFNSQKDLNLLILDPGQSLLITAQATANATVISSLGWYEL